MKRYIILVLICLFLVWFISSPRVKISLKRACPIAPTSQSISENEANIFLKQFQEYKSRGYHKKVIENFSFDETSTDKRLPWIVKKWFEVNCINPTRFYYVEQRLHTILKAQSHKNHTDNVISVISEMITPEIDEEKRDWYLSIIEGLKKISKIEGITASELEIIKNREKEISNILE